jgi:hypothetical protein
VKLTAKMAEVPPSAIDSNNPAFLVSLMARSLQGYDDGNNNKADATGKRSAQLPM